LFIEEELFMEDFVIRLDHIGLRVSSVENSLLFYQKILGMNVISTVAGDYAHLSFPNSSRKVISLIEESSTSQAALLGHPGERAHFALETADISAFYQFFQRIKEYGCSFKAIDHEVSWTIYVDDPDSNNVEVFLARTRDVDQNGEIISKEISENSQAAGEASILAWRGATTFLAEDAIEEEYQRYKKDSLQ
jgi:catechol-2,3-dioxygenase